MKNVFAPCLILFSLFGLFGCGDDEPNSAAEPFIIQVNSRDVIAGSVTSLRIVLEPGAVGQGFEMVPDMTSFGGEVSTQVSGAGEVFIDIQGAYVDRELEAAANPNILWTLEVPVRTVSVEDDPAIQDPPLRVQFSRGTEIIAEGARSLSWPPLPGERAVVTVLCLPGTAAQCQNMAGMASGDAGVPDAP